jgi:hypothetical protein
MPNDRSAQPEQDWEAKLLEADSLRSYGPAQGPDEPGQPPPGRASASSVTGDTSQAAGTRPQNQAQADTDPDG